jgi:predicted permease
VIEVALAFTLVVGAGVLVKDLVLLRGREAGIRTDRIVAFNLTPSGNRYQSPEQTVAFYRELYERISQVEAVDTVGMTSHLPMYSFGYNGEFTVEGAAPPDNIARFVEYRWIYGDFLKTVGVPLVKGRLLDQRDGKDTRTVLVTQAMADKFWPGQDPIGKRFWQGTDAAGGFEIAGVIGNIRSYGLERSAPFEFYRTLDQSSFNAMTVVIRTHADDPAAVMPTVRRIVASVDPNVPISQVQTLERVVAGSVGQPRLVSALTSLFGSLAGLLAMVGVYGVMAFNVRRQRREFGIRLALGADTVKVQRLVVGRGLALGVMGVALGAAGAWMLTRALTTMLHDVTPTDPAIFAGMAAAVLLTTFAATYLPARNAGRVDPVIVLRDV